MDRTTLLGMTAGATFMFGFGVVWLLLGLFRGRSSPLWLRLSLLAAGIALGASIATLGARASALPGNIATPVHQLALNRQIERHFHLIFGAELVAILVAVVVLNALGYSDYILCGIALIVGVHFFPLGALFKTPLYYGTASIGCAIGLVGFFISDPGFRQKVVGLSFGLLLWGTAVSIMCSALRFA